MKLEELKAAVRSYIKSETMGKFYFRMSLSRNQKGMSLP